MGDEQTSSKVVGTVVCLPVRDLDAALRFYRSVFDLPGLEAEEGIVVVELPNLSLFLIEEGAFESYTRKAGRGVQYPEAATGVRNLDERNTGRDARGGHSVRRHRAETGRRG